MAATTKCPFCGFENDSAAKECASIPCHSYLKSELECFRSIDLSLRTIKRIAIWWLILSIAAIVVGIPAILSRF
jgi:hypothetical protein